MNDHSKLITLVSLLAIYSLTVTLKYLSAFRSGANAVIRSLNLKSGDAVLINMYTYGAVKNMCFLLAEQQG